MPSPIAITTRKNLPARLLWLGYTQHVDGLTLSHRQGVYHVQGWRQGVYRWTVHRTLAKARRAL